MEGIIAEPASAATLAAADILHRRGVIRDSSLVVCVLTGSGLRDLKLFADENAEIPQVNPGDPDGLKSAVAFYDKDRS